jgi:hypothetical protein
MAGCAPSHYSKGISSFAAAAAPALDKVDPTAAVAASGKMTPQQMGLILSGLDAALKLYLDRKVRGRGIPPPAA